MTEPKFLGITVNKYADDIRRYCRLFGAKSLLDYGCGQARGYQDKYGLLKRWSLDTVTLYDPNVEKYNKTPLGEYDAVISIDVIEHLEEKDLDEFVKTLFKYTKLFLFITICTRLAKKTLADGSNAHKTIKPEQWWRDFIGTRAGDKWVFLRFTL